jgi:hypothetical protein
MKAKIVVWGIAILAGVAAMIGDNYESGEWDFASRG